MIWQSFLWNNDILWYQSTRKQINKQRYLTFSKQITNDIRHFRECGRRRQVTSDPNLATLLCYKVIVSPFWFSAPLNASWGLFHLPMCHTTRSLAQSMLFSFTDKTVQQEITSNFNNLCLCTMCHDWLT